MLKVAKPSAAKKKKHGLSKGKKTGETEAMFPKCQKRANRLGKRTIKMELTYLRKLMIRKTEARSLSTESTIARSIP